MNIKRVVLWTLGAWMALESILALGISFIALFGFLTFTLFGAAWGTLLTASLVLPFMWSVARWSVLPWFQRFTLKYSN